MLHQEASSCCQDLSVDSTGSLKGNWEELWRQVQRDHAHAGLLWNERTRAELRDALQVG